MIEPQRFLRMEFEKRGVYVHPTAEIQLDRSETPADAMLRIGRGTKIWRHCHVMPRAKIGEDCTLGQGVFVDRGVSIGSRVKIQNNVSVYRGVTLEDDVFVGPSAVFTNVKNPRVPFPKEPHEYDKTLIKKCASICANATIVCGVTIGEYALVGAGAVVTKDVSDHALVVGVPGHVAGYACCCGHRLVNWADEWSCILCERTYRFP